MPLSAEAREGAPATGAPLHVEWSPPPADGGAPVSDYRLEWFRRASAALSAGCADPWPAACDAFGYREVQSLLILEAPSPRGAAASVDLDRNGRASDDADSSLDGTFTLGAGPLSVPLPGTLRLLRIARLESALPPGAPPFAPLSGSFTLSSDTRACADAPL